MSYTSLAVTAPHATAYDEDYPTRSTENYAHSLHNILQDMEDATGGWYLHDGYPSAAHITAIEAWIRDAVKVVFDYAESAIEEHRAEQTITLSEPSTTEFDPPPNYLYPVFQEIELKLETECYKTMYLIYYLWNLKKTIYFS